MTPSIQVSEEMIARLLMADNTPHANAISEYAANWLAKRILAMKAVERPSTDDWRCVGCKRVIASATEPERCFHCHCRQFARIDPTTKTVEQPLVLDEVERLRNALNLAITTLNTVKIGFEDGGQIAPATIIENVLLKIDAISAIEGLGDE